VCGVSAGTAASLYGYAVKEYLDFVAELKKLVKSLRAGYVKEAMKNYKNRGSIGKTDP